MKYKEAQQRYYDKAFEGSRFYKFAETQDPSILTNKERDLLDFVIEGCETTNRNKPTWEAFGRFLYSSTQILKQEENISLETLTECLVISFENKKVDDEGCLKYAVGVLKTKMGLFR